MERLNKSCELKAMSLFSGGGIGETYLEEIGIHTEVANEFVKERAEIYKYRFPETNMIVGDIKEKKDEIIRAGLKSRVKLLLATPPCQGMSMLGKRDYMHDDRNLLIFEVFDIMDAIDFDYILIENVGKFLDMYYPKSIEGIHELSPSEREAACDTLFTDLIREKYGDRYEIKHGIYDASDYGVPQIRKRAFVRMYKKGLSWEDPQKCKKKITLREAIGWLPSIEIGEKAIETYPCSAEVPGMKYHVGPPMNPRHIEMMKHTPSGCSAYDNPVWYPKRSDGKRISGYKNTYTRLKWDNVCPTRTMKSANISGSNNGHPGRELGNGLYSDARTLSLLELIIVSSLPINIDLPDDASENLIRDIIGEGVPPRMLEAFLKMIV